MKRLITLILSATLIFTLFSSPFSSIAVENELLPLSADLQEKESIANEKYNRLLLEWAFDKNYVSDTKANFPSFYGGAYIDDQKNLVIQITGEMAMAKSYFSDLIDTNNVVFEPVEYSFSTLLMEQHNLTETLLSRRSGYSDISGVGLSLKTNSINVCLDMSNINNDELSQLKSNYSLQFPNITFVDSPAPTTCATVEPGSIVDNRSVGFWARNSSNAIGVVTAPHNSIMKGQNIFINSTLFGIADSVSFGVNVDSAFIRRTNSSFTPDLYVPGHNFTLSSSTYTLLAEGSTTYSRGRMSGARTGMVKSISHNFTYFFDKTTDKDDVDMVDCVLATQYCQGGDSGGLVAGGGNTSTRNIVGSITGETGNELVYVKVGNTLSALGLSIY